MCKNSTELLDYALRELQVAVANNKPKVEIVLCDIFFGKAKEIEEYTDKFEIKTITEMLREEFKTYSITSEVFRKGHLKGALTFSEGPCSLGFPLVWKLKLQKKAT